MYGFCVVHNEFHGRCYSVLPGLNKVVLAAFMCAMMLLKQCYLLL